MALLNSKTTKTNTSTAVLDEQKKITKGKLSTEKKQKVKPSFVAIAPAVDLSNNEFIEMSSGEYCEILQITSKDIYSLNLPDLYKDIDNLTNFFIGYPEDQKFVPLNIPLQLEVQKRHITKKMKQTNNPLHRKFLENRLQEFKNLERERTNREYFLFIYNKDEQKLMQKVNQIKNALSRSNPIIPISAEKKISILFQMANPCVKPIVD
ncbi:hypothetical protein [Lysinibacillus fusiformis]|uniref:hypothetical protein n=1 Tax=Lysinibacillus fusiformis TaxID=28031 RepID=UPI0023A95BAB|nr:hypothetical protein [Lysinibacillus fusiformis]WEA41779.1 hypothetical protein PWJ66_23755 [Lysinibacillus fusiformis]